MRVLILCTGNSCRSQMAEAFLRSIDPSLDVYSAGTRPAERVHPLAIAVMHEVGIDLSNARPKSVEMVLDQSFDFVITVCDDARESCPVFTGSTGSSIHIRFDDPAEATGDRDQVIAEFRRIRDEIMGRFREWHSSLPKGGAP